MTTKSLSPRLASYLSGNLPCAGSKEGVLMRSRRAASVAMRRFMRVPPKMEGFAAFNNIYFDLGRKSMQKKEKRRKQTSLTDR
jgi:hypothetical protein